MAKKYRIIKVTQGDAVYFSAQEKNRLLDTILLQERWLTVAESYDYDRLKYALDLRQRNKMPTTSEIVWESE